MHWIDNIILGLIESFNTQNVYELCDCLDIEIRCVEPHSPLLNKNKSFYYRIFGEKEIIFINGKLENPLKDFIIKHELGHALLHTNILYSSMCNTGKLERQANYFALRLSNITFDEVELQGMTLNQIANCLR